MAIRRKSNSEEAAPLYRSGAVARMLRMPVSTLRMWEQRHRVVAPATAASGQRLYRAADVQRLALLRQLSAHGCPRHVAELLMQLGQFEAYSAECRPRSPDDAALHDHLRPVAGAARAMFEGALERVAAQEGLVLPG